MQRLPRGGSQRGIAGADLAVVELQVRAPHPDIRGSAAHQHRIDVERLAEPDELEDINEDVANKFVQVKEELSGWLDGNPGDELAGQMRAELATSPAR